MKVRVDARPPVPGAWRAMKHFEKKVLLAKFRGDHLASEARINRMRQLHAVEGALSTRLTPEFRLLAEKERIKLKS